MTQLPPIVGHRGAAARAPENTLPGIEVAAALGVQAVELDVALSKDGVPVLFHDPSIERTTDGAGALAMHTLQDLERRDAGAWFHADFAGTKIPTMEQAIALVVKLQLGVNFEIKPQPGTDAQTAQAMVATLAHHWPQDQSLPLLLASFSMTALAAAKIAGPDIPRAAIFAHGVPGDWLATAKPHQPRSLHINKESLDADTVAAIKNAGYAVGAYTVNSFWEAKRLADAGVDYVFSDCPDELAGAFD